MKKIVPLVMFLFSAVFAEAQVMILHDPISATIYSSSKYSGINGSPFLSDKWSKGYVRVSAGIYKDLELKYDAYENTLYFNRDDQPYQFKENVLEFVLTPQPKDSATFVRYKKGITGSMIKPDQFLQVITEGKLSIYRSELKLVSEVNQINQGLIKTFNTSTRYVAVKDGNTQLIRLNKPDILNLMDDKKSEVEKYADQNNLSFKKEWDVKMIVNFYNRQ